MSIDNVRDGENQPYFETDDEKAHFFSILTSFKFYRKFSLLRVTKTENCLNSLPESHQKMLKNYRAHIKKIRDCIEANNKVILHIVRDVDCLFYNVPTANISEYINEIQPTVQDMEKVQSTLKQFFRDWSSEGAEEREQCYTPIIDEIINNFPKEKSMRTDINILVPGAGLGRLAYELAHLGFSCQGNEFSVFMLFASNFVLNRCREVNQYKLHPWAHQYVNNELRSDQTKSICFPDVLPSLEDPSNKFSMAAGDFLQIYKNADEWNCVATCFFIDCANNVVQFIEAIYKILVPGGMWVNLGPLLYHYSDVPFEESIEPSFEDLMEIITKVGFIVQKSQTGVRTKYAQNPRSMLQSEYKSIFFVCFKPDNISEEMDTIYTSAKNLH